VACRSTINDTARRHATGTLLSATLDTVIGRWRRVCGRFMRTTLVSRGNILAVPIIGWILCIFEHLIGGERSDEAMTATCCGAGSRFNDSGIRYFPRVGTIAATPDDWSARTDPSSRKALQLDGRATPEARPSLSPTLV